MYRNTHQYAHKGIGGIKQCSQYRRQFVLRDFFCNFGGFILKKASQTAQLSSGSLATDFENTMFGSFVYKRARTQQLTAVIIIIYAKLSLYQTCRRRLPLFNPPDDPSNVQESSLVTQMDDDW